MLTNDNLICPSDGVPINETKVRVVAGLVLLTVLLYLLSNGLWAGNPLLLILLAVDFGLRSVDLGKYSPFGNLAERIVSLAKLPYKRTDQAPKRFAARIGLAFCLLMTGLYLAGISTVIPAVVLAIFAALESLAGFCAGCYVYTYYARLFPKSV